MFEEVRIYNGKGKLTKVIKSKESSKRFWDNYFNSIGKDIRPQVSTRKGKRGPSPSEWAGMDDDYWFDYGVLPDK